MVKAVFGPINTLNSTFPSLACKGNGSGEVWERGGEGHSIKILESHLMSYSCPCLEEPMISNVT
jgi:hypothetical protein